MKNTIYEWLMHKRNTAQGWMEARLFALMLAYRSTSCYWSIEAMLGLTGMEIRALISRYFPFAIPSVPFIEAGHRPACYKIHFHISIKQPFICHCCGQAATPEGEIKKLDI